MTIPMIEVFQTKSGDWEAVSSPINTTDKLEWFDDLKGWKTIQAHVIINGVIKSYPVYLTSPKTGWVCCHDFSPNIM